jgi:hypothetical protein
MDLLQLKIGSRCPQHVNYGLSYGTAFAPTVRCHVAEILVRGTSLLAGSPVKPCRTPP